MKMVCFAPGKCCLAALTCVKPKAAGVVDSHTGDSLPSAENEIDFSPWNYFFWPQILQVSEAGEWGMNPGRGL